MKRNKWLRMLSAAIAAIMLVIIGGGLQVLAKNITIKPGDIYKAADLFDKTSDFSDLTINQNQTTYESEWGKPFGEFSTLTLANYPKYAKGIDVNAELTYNFKSNCSYTLYMFLIEYNNRYPNVYLDNTQLINGNNLTGTKIGTSTALNRSITIIPVDLSKDLDKQDIEITEGEHIIKLTPPANNNVVGVIAVTLVSSVQRYILNAHR